MSYGDHRSRDRDRGSVRERDSRDSRRESVVYDKRDKYAGDYISICLKNLNESLSDTQLHDAIYGEFKKFGNFNIKIVNNKNSRDRRTDRIAFINFNSHYEAKEAKRCKMNIPFNGMPLYIEPVFRNRSNAPHESNSHPSSKQSYRVNTPPLPSRGRGNKSRSIFSGGSSGSRSRSKSRSRSSRRRYSSVDSLPNTKSSSYYNSRHPVPPPPPPPAHRSGSIYERLSTSNKKSYKSKSRSPPPPSSRHRSSSNYDTYSSSYSSHHHPPPPSHHHLPPPPQHYTKQHDYFTSKIIYPNHLEHLEPEYDKDATRTIFIGNLDSDMERDELKVLFDRFGYIEEIDIKRQPNKKSYAFIKYVNLDMAYNAKVEMSGKILGKNECKIGYGKVNPTTCVWIGGLNSKARKRDLEKEFGRYGKIKEIDWNPGDQYAYLLFDNVDDSEDACNNLRGKYLPGGSSSRLRLDYADPKRFGGSSVPISASSSSKRVNTSRSVSPKQQKSLSRSRSHSAASSVASSTQARKERKHHSTKENNNKLQKRSAYVLSSKNNSDEEIVEKNDVELENEKVSHKKQKISSRVRSPSATARSPLPPPPPSQKQRQATSPPPPASPKQPNSPSQLALEHSYSSKSPNVKSSSHHHHSSTSKHHHLDSNLLLIKDSLINKDLISNGAVTQINELSQLMKSSWSGVFTLKKIAFPTKFYLLAGNKYLAEQLLPQNKTNINLACLRITQRLRLDPSKVDELEKKLYDSNYNQKLSPSVTDNCLFSVLLALPADVNNEKTTKSNKQNDVDNEVDYDESMNTTSTINSMQQRQLHNLIVYLNQKSAAGVIPLPDDDKPTAMVHAFPPNCHFSIKLLQQLLPHIKNNSDSTNSFSSNTDYLIIVLLKNL